MQAATCCKSAWIVDLLISLLSLVSGLVLLVAAGDILVRGAVKIATSLDVSPLIIGLTIIAMGTSAPELLVGINAVLAGVPELALGNVVGSNTANVLLVVGIPAMIYPVACSTPRLGRNLIFMLAASALVVAMGVFPGYIGFLQAVLLLAGLAGFLIWSATRAKHGVVMADDADLAETAKKDSTAKALLFLVLGLVGLPLGADLLVDGAVAIARSLHVSEAVIGLTLVAIGTSLPELVTALAAAWRGHSEVAIGNVIGSNVFNLLGILGGTAMFGSIPIPPAFLHVDFPIMIGSSLLLLPFVLARAAIGRMTGALMLGGYIAYMLFLSQTAQQGAL